MRSSFRPLTAAALILPMVLVFAGCRGVQTTQAGATSGSSNGSTELPSTQSQVQRVIVVMLQNSSFDHMFGTFPGANGIHPGVPGYTQTDASGNAVQPFLLSDLAPKNFVEGRIVDLQMVDNNQMDKFAFYNGDQTMGYYDGTTPGISTLWGYAQQFALADNYFQSVMGEAPTNQLYMVAADDDNVTHPVQPAFGPCNPPDKFAQPYSFPNVGDQLTQKGISWAVYQEQYGLCGFFNPEHDPFQYFVSTNNSAHIQDFGQFGAQLANGTLPPVSFIIPGPGHDLHPGAPIIPATNWIDQFIQQVQASSAWPNLAIVITFDDGGGWYDHVPPPTVDAQGLGFRVPLLVISPLAKKGYISHVQMDHVSILKFIQWNWGLASLNSRNDTSTDIRDMFAF